MNRVAAASWPSETRWLEEILGTIGEFGSASLGLVAWELSLDECELMPAWDEARRAGLIQRTHACPATHEEMYSLAGAPPLATAPPLAGASAPSLAGASSLPAVRPVPPPGDAGP